MLSKKVENSLDEIKTNKDTGLSSEEVNQRVQDGLTNYVRKSAGKSYKEIFLGNLVTFYNILLLIIAILLIIGHQYTSLFFIVVYLANLIIGIYQDLKAKRLLTKLQVITQPTCAVIRDGKESTISTDDIVIDDIIVVSSGNQICVDGEILEGEIGLNESALTGESLTIYKKEGQEIYSGSYVVSGTAKVLVNRVGKDSYVNTLTNAARKQKHARSEVKYSLNFLFKIIGGFVIGVGILTIIVNWKGLAFDFSHTIGPIAGSLVSMIPAGLYLLSSVSFSVGVINLAKRKTLVQDLYSIETLARADILCLDKTGTLTSGEMEFKELVTFGNHNKADIEMVLVNHISATKDTNPTAVALKKAFAYEQTQTPIYVCPFTSENKYSFVTYHNSSYALGALDFMDATNKDEAEAKLKEYASQGYRVLVLAKSHTVQTGKKLNCKVDVIALVVLQDHIKEDAKETMAWFQNNGVELKIISGDDPITVSHIATEVGVKSADKYISLYGLSDEEVRKKAKDYVVFGRVTPEQKAILVDSLKYGDGQKKNRKIVAMTGDGINDILALKKADCSIAMANGSQAAQNVSQLVMLDSNFASLPSVVAEGRRVVNNLKRTSSLFLVKTTFAIICSSFFIISKIFGGDSFPFHTNHLYLWEISVIGVGAFFASLEPNAEPIKGHFLSNILKSSLPAAAMILTSVGVVYLLYVWQLEEIMYTSIYDQNTLVTMCSLMFGIIPFAHFFLICRPFSKYRVFVFLGCLLIDAILVTIIFSLENRWSELFMVYPSKLNALNYLEIGCVSISVMGIYLFVLKITEAIFSFKESSKK